MSNHDTWRGKPLDQMTKQELIDAIREQDRLHRATVQQLESRCSKHIEMIEYRPRRRSLLEYILEEFD